MNKPKTRNALQEQFINYFNTLKTKNDYALYPTFKISKMFADSIFIRQLENINLKNFNLCYDKPSNLKIECENKCYDLAVLLALKYDMVNYGVYSFNKFRFTYMILCKDALNYYCIYLSPSKTLITMYEIA